MLRLGNLSGRHRAVSLDELIAHVRLAPECQGMSETLVAMAATGLGATPSRYRNRPVYMLNQRIAQRIIKLRGFELLDLTKFPAVG